MRLYVYVLEGKEFNIEKNKCYVKLQVGKHKSKTRALRRPKGIDCNFTWNEEFVFRVHHMDEELVVSVWDQPDDDSGLFHGSGEFMGRVRIPVWSVLEQDNHTMSPTWFSLEKPITNNANHVNVNDCGKILLTISLHGKLHEFHDHHLLETNSDITIEEDEQHYALSPQGRGNTKFTSRKVPDSKHLIKSLASRFEKLFHKNGEASKSDESLESSSLESEYEDCLEEDILLHSSFEEALKTMQSKDRSEQEMPDDLQGGVLIDQVYRVAPSDLNTFLFAPNSQFARDLAKLQGSTDFIEGPWSWGSGDRDTLRLTRAVSYTKAATKLVKAVKATEEQMYVKADGKEYAVFVSVSTPDVPYGNSFKVELLYKIMSGPELASGDESARLVVSWGIKFFQTTMMKTMIEGGARQGLKESFDQFANLLSHSFKAVNNSVLSNKDHILSDLQAEQQSDWELASEYFCNITVFVTVFMVLCVVVHILVSEPTQPHGLEFLGLDFPDSFGELIACGILFIHLERVFNMVSHFVQARLQRGGDHGVKAHGDGWVLTVALIEGSDLATVGSSDLSDPYVVLTCNAKTRTSSVKLQTRDPQWNEILEFDAMDEPPSVLDVEVYDFDGPFDQATSLGHAEINFLKHTSTELADMWVPLEGKLAQSSRSKLHLRVFLDNTNGVETIREYLTKMEKEVGKKLNLRSPHRNSAFQKLFGLPPEEFLISDFTCQLKRKLPLQGRLFLSARIVGFYANLFGHKTKFFFLWEDIEDIQIHPPTLASVGSPQLVILLKKDRGTDARHGAKSQDDEGRLRFCFQSFVSFNGASRTITALWRTRTLTPDQKAQIAEDQEDQEQRSVMIEETDYALDVEDAKMSKIFSAELPININAMMKMFDGGKLEHKVMEKLGCLNYTTTSWEKPNKDDDVLERRLSYKFNRHVSMFGGEVTCTQQKYSLPNKQGWILNEVMALHDLPFSDHFRVHFRYQIEELDLAYNACKCDLFIGITWLKSTKFQHRIARNIIDKFTDRSREIFLLFEREILFANQRDIAL